jgi:hypothetical protein
MRTHYNPGYFGVLFAASHPYLTSPIPSLYILCTVMGFVILLVFLLGIFRRALRPSDTRGTLVPFYFPGGALPLKKTNYW